MWPKLVVRGSGCRFVGFICIVNHLSSYKLVQWMQQVDVDLLGSFAL